MESFFFLKQVQCATYIKGDMGGVELVSVHVCVCAYIIQESFIQSVLPS